MNIMDKEWTIWSNKGDEYCIRVGQESIILTKDKLKELMRNGLVVKGYTVTSDNRLIQTTRKTTGKAAKQSRMYKYTIDTRTHKITKGTSKTKGISKKEEIKFHRYTYDTRAGKKLEYDTNLKVVFDSDYCLNSGGLCIHAICIPAGANMSRVETLLKNADVPFVPIDKVYRADRIVRYPYLDIQLPEGTMVIPPTGGDFDCENCLYILPNGVRISDQSC